LSCNIKFLGNKLMECYKASIRFIWSLDYSACKPAAGMLPMDFSSVSQLG